MQLNLQQVANIRDLGGIATRYGTIQPDRLIRSGHLSIITPEDISVLLRHKLRRVIDLRTAAEIANHPDVPMENVEFVNVSIMSATTFGISYETLDGAQIAVKLEAGVNRMLARGETPIEHMRILYRMFVEDPHSREGYGKFLKILANNPVEGATLWHCTGGKDRCGTCAALLLYCLGADKTAIMTDYMETNVQTCAHAESILAKVRPHVTAERLELVQSMLLVEESYLESFFAEIRKNFGGMDGFLTNCGVTTADVARLRKEYLY